MGMTDKSLCDSCTNIGCEFQSGIVRTKCAFYMPPQLEADNCGNYVVQESTTKNDLGVDAISREQALRELKESAEHHANDSREKALLLRDRDIIRTLPSVTPQEPSWIPVTERLPEAGQNVLFCDSDNYIMVGYHIKGRPDTHFSQDGTYEDMKNVRAWMPLPEPYKAESEE